MIRMKENGGKHEYMFGGESCSARVASSGSISALCICGSWIWRPFRSKQPANSVTTHCPLSPPPVFLVSKKKSKKNSIQYKTSMCKKWILKWPIYLQQIKHCLCYYYWIRSGVIVKQFFVFFFLTHDPFSACLQFFHGNDLLLESIYVKLEMRNLQLLEMKLQKAS